MAILTKSDHGGVLALCLGLAALTRVRFRVIGLARSGGGLLLGCALVPTLLWFAHPDKLAALDKLCRHLGMFTDNVHHTGTVELTHAKSMTDEELEERAEYLRNRIKPGAQVIELVKQSSNGAGE